MTKRIIALLLALILTVGLLPTVAMAAEPAPTLDGDSTGTTDPVSEVKHEAANDPIHIKKSVSEDAEGNNYLTMEAYVTNPLVIKQEMVPLDIVLVLDVSGSMTEDFTTSTTEGHMPYADYTTNKTYQKASEVYYKNADGTFSEVTVTKKDVYEAVNDLTYYELWNKSDDVTYYARKGNKDHKLKISYKGGLSGGYYQLSYDGNKDRIENFNSQIQLRSGYTLYKKSVVYTYTIKGTNQTMLTSVGDNGRPLDSNGQVVTFYYTTTSSANTKKIKALKDAAKSFIENVAGQDLGEDGVYHRISIVKFASGKPDPENKVGNDVDDDEYNYSQIVTNLTNVDETGKTDLTNAVSALTPAGATRADYGMEQAQYVLNNRADEEKSRPSVVIMFTDGVPTKYREFDSDVAEKAITAARTLKKVNGTIVYTIAVYDDADPGAPVNPTEGLNNNIDGYLHAVSSNYPDAEVKGSNSSRYIDFGTRVSDKNYYFKASSSVDLSTIFEKISSEVSDLALKVDESAVLSDTLSGFFSFDIDDTTKLTGITVKRVPVNDTVDANGNVTWNTSDDAVEDLTGKVKINVSGKTITVEGFDYGKYAVTKHQDGSAEGSKLVITFPIKPDDSAKPDGTEKWEDGTHNYPTNDTGDNKAGLGDYAYKATPNTKDQETRLTESPEIQIKAHTVSYEVAGNGNTGYTVPTSKVYREGQSYTIEDRLPDSSGYKFTGWCKDDKTCTSNPTTDPQTMGTTNVTYYGKFEKNEVTVDLSKFVQKKLELTGVTELPTEEQFTVTLTEGSTTLIATTDAMKSTPGASNLPTFKNGLQSVKLSVGQHTFKVKETVGSTLGMTYDSAEYTLTVTANANGTAAANTVTITNSYAPTSGDGFTLNGKFQKMLVSNVELSKLPDAAKSFELKIWEGTDTAATAKATGTATINSLTKDEQTGKYTGSANFNFGNTVLTFTEAKEYTYTVKETVGTVAGMQYDTNTYTLTITVVNNNGKFEVQSATIGSTDMKNGGPLTITNTFTAATLPLDPPKDPDGSVTGEGKVVKVMTGDTREDDMTFTAEMTGPGITGEKTATATVAAKANGASFNGFGTLVFTEAKTYNYTIKEIHGSTAGMKYDEHFLNGHTMNITVEAEGNKLVVKTVTIDGTEINLADDAWLTITNTYTKPAYTVEKSVITEEKDNDTGYALNYPVNGKVIVDADTDEIRLGYVIKITGNAGASFTLEEDADGKFIATSASEVTVITAEKKLSITLSADHNDGNPILIYAVKDISRDTMTKAFPATVKNVVTEEDNTPHESGETTIEERGALTVDFGALVHKHLTVTGDKSFNGTNFTVNFTEGLYAPLVVSNSIEVYADAGVGEEKLPDLTASVTYTADERNRGLKDFDGADLTINTEGNYSYIVSEQIPAGATGYDTKKYVVGIVVVPDGDGLKVEHVWYHELVEDLATYTEIIPGGPTFYNTIDTGKDDYYPIIIPTIINKDTGMLNKTDHFAYVIGYPDGTVHPNGQITRAEVATIFFRLLRDEVRDGAFTTSNSYSDVAYGKWYNNPISTMSALGIITGYPDGTFKPNKPITRAEFAAIAARFDETQSGKSATFSDVIGHWAAKEIGIAYYNDWIKGYPDGTFKPDQNITRAEAMTLINRVLERKPESPADLLTNMNKWTDNMDTSKWYYLDVQEATNSHGYTRKTFNYELWRQMLPDPDWSRYER